MKRKNEWASPHERIKWIGLLFVRLAIWCVCAALAVWLFYVGRGLVGQCAWKSVLGIALMVVSAAIAIFDILTPLKLFICMYDVWTSPFLREEEDLAVKRRGREKARAAALVAEQAHR